MDGDIRREGLVLKILSRVAQSRFFSVTVPLGVVAFFLVLLVLDGHSSRTPATRGRGVVQAILRLPISPFLTSVSQRGREENRKRSLAMSAGAHNSTHVSSVNRTHVCRVHSTHVFCVNTTRVS